MSELYRFEFLAHQTNPERRRVRTADTTVAVIAPTLKAAYPKLWELLGTGPVHGWVWRASITSITPHKEKTMNNHMKAAVGAVAKEIHSSGWTCDSHEPLGLDKCPSCRHLTTATAKLTITAALPHIRAMIADDIRTGADPAYALDFDPQGDYAQGYRQGIRQAAEIAEAK